MAAGIESAFAREGTVEFGAALAVGLLSVPASALLVLAGTFKPALSAALLLMLVVAGVATHVVGQRLRPSIPVRFAVGVGMGLYVPAAFGELALLALVVTSAFM